MRSPRAKEASKRASGEKNWPRWCAPRFFKLGVYITKRVCCAGEAALNSQSHCHGEQQAVLLLVGKGLVILADSCSCFVATSIFIYNIFLTLSLSSIYLGTSPPRLECLENSPLLEAQRHFLYCSPTNFFRHSTRRRNEKFGQNGIKKPRNEKAPPMRPAIELSGIFVCV